MPPSKSRHTSIPLTSSEIRLLVQWYEDVGSTDGEIASIETAIESGEVDPETARNIIRARDEYSPTDEIYWTAPYQRFWDKIALLGLKA